MSEYSDYSEEDFYLTKRYKGWLSSRPLCDDCGEPIEEDFAYEIDGRTLCEECFMDYMREHYRKRIY
jgi:formylmethanofuran dehydrogenase subunit E